MLDSAPPSELVLSSSWRTPSRAPVPNAAPPHAAPRHGAPIPANDGRLEVGRSRGRAQLVDVSAALAVTEQVAEREAPAAAPDSSRTWKTRRRQAPPPPRRRQRRWPWLPACPACSQHAAIRGAGAAIPAGPVSWVVVENLTWGGVGRERRRPSLQPGRMRCSCRAPLLPGRTRCSCRASLLPAQVFMVSFERFPSLPECSLATSVLMSRQQCLQGLTVASSMRHCSLTCSSPRAAV